MKLRIHTCKALACQRVISIRMLMCLDHWRMVPAPVRRDVLQTLRDMKVSPTVEAVERYSQAAARAVVAVQRKQEKKAAAAAGPIGDLFQTTQ